MAQTRGRKRSSFYFVSISRSVTIHCCIAVGLSDASPSLIQEAEKEEDAHSGRAGGRKSNEYIVSKAFPERGKFDRSADNNVMAQCKKKSTDSERTETSTRNSEQRRKPF